MSFTDRHVESGASGGGLTEVELGEGGAPSQSQPPPLQAADVVVTDRRAGTFDASVPAPTGAPQDARPGDRERGPGGGLTRRAKLDWRQSFRRRRDFQSNQRAIEVGEESGDALRDRFHEVEAAYESRLDAYEARLKDMRSRVGQLERDNERLLRENADVRGSMLERETARTRELENERERVRALEEEVARLRPPPTVSPPLSPRGLPPTAGEDGAAERQRAGSTTAFSTLTRAVTAAARRSSLFGAPPPSRRPSQAVPPMSPNVQVIVAGAAAAPASQAQVAPSSAPPLQTMASNPILMAEANAAKTMSGRSLQP